MILSICLAGLMAVSTFALAGIAAAQETEGKPPPCSPPEFRQFDFWVGSWDLTWAEDGKGTNVVEHKFGDCVVQENFDGGGFRGMSVSTYDPSSKRWKQTWVDSNGSYLDFIGGMQGDRMVLSRTARRDGKDVEQRMTFYNIEERSLDWDWEISTDGGESWNLRWRIHYARRH
jgi:hypothetical protein